MSDAATRRRARGGGGAARRAARSAVSFDTAKYIERNIPNFEVLTEEVLEIIETNAETLLEEIGVNFVNNPAACARWKEAGADVQGERVHIPRGLARKLCATAPSSFTQHARNPERNVVIGGKGLVCAPVYGPPFVRDMAGGRRYATMEDFRKFVKLGYMSKWLHHSGGTVCEPTDVAVNKRHLDMLHAHMTLSDKPFMGSVTEPSRAQDSVEMCEILFGRDFVQQNTVMTSLINVNSPMTFDDVMMGALEVYAANNHAVMCSPFSMAAASTPASNVGTMAVVTAEALMAIAFAQLVRPGSPMLFGVPAMTVALNTGAPVHGSPDSAIVQFLAGQMARRYGIPHRAIANCATSKSADMQAAYDSMWGLFPSFLAGAQWITMAGGMMEGTLGVGYAKTVIDFEQLDAFYHFCQGCRFDDLDEIFETVKDVGPGGHFLGSAHTRKANLFIFPSQNNVTYEQWDDEGRKDSEQVGLDKAKQWLARYEEPEFDPTIDEALSTFITEKEATIP
uniref:trimethylamine methyltransferase family protein n=1 Tax=Marinovum algicola TaxID=42444 RepID=UPI0024B919B7